MVIANNTPDQDIEQIGLAIVQWLNKHPQDKEFQSFASHSSGYVDTISLPGGKPVYSRNFHQAVWMLLRQGLVFFDRTWNDPHFWRMQLTARGHSAAESGEFNPYDGERYITSLQASVPAVSLTVKQYTGEALVCFRNGCCLAAVVMLGVASEAAFFEMVEALESWLQGTHLDEFRRKYRQKRQYNDKFELFRHTVEQHKAQIDHALWENMDLWFNAVLDTFRTFRNDAGHALGEPVGAEVAEMVLSMFPNYTRRLYGFKSFFESNVQTL